MTSNISINYDYSKEELLSLFNSSAKNPAENSPSIILTELGEESYNSKKLVEFFNKFFFIPRNDNSCELAEFIDTTRPHINADNNGLLVFPVSGLLRLSTYDWKTPVKDSDGRPSMDFLNMSDSEIADIESTKISTVDIVSPIAIDGLTTFSLNSAEPNTIVFIMKISKLQSWESVVETLNNM